MGGRRDFCAMVNGKRAQRGGGVIRKCMDRHGKYLLNRDGERVKRGSWGAFWEEEPTCARHGDEDMTSQSEEMTRGLSWLDLDGMHEGKQKKDSGDKGLDAMLPALKMMLRRLEAGHLCGPVPAGSTVLCVCEDVPGEQGSWGRALWRGLGILELMIKS